MLRAYERESGGRRRAVEPHRPDMTRSERDLVTALRAELAAIDPARACDRAAEAVGLGTDAVARDGPAARLAVRLRRTTTDDPAIGDFDWASAADHCRSAWLRGRFLARGSLSLAGGRTHLEFVVPAGGGTDPCGAPPRPGAAGVVAAPARARAS